MTYTPAWLSTLQAALSIPFDWVRPLFSIQWGWGSATAPDYSNVRVRWLTDTPSLYMNGVAFFGVQIAPHLLPYQLGVVAMLTIVFGWHWCYLLLLACLVNFMFRWSATDFVQMHIGWRPIDGSPVIVFRIQNDASAQGGLIGGYQDGPK